MSFSLNPIAPYLKYIKVGGILILTLSIILYIQSLKHSNTELLLRLSQANLSLTEFKLQSQVREQTLQQVIVTQQDSINRANLLYTNVNSSLGLMIKQNKAFMAERTKVFENQQAQLQSANIPSNCVEALKFMITYPTKTWETNK